MGILFVQHLCSILIFHHCQESRLTVSWILVCLLLSLLSDRFLACPFLRISCLPPHAAFSLVFLLPGPLPRSCTFYTLLYSLASAIVRAVKTKDWPCRSDGCCLTQPFYVICSVPGSECLYHGLHKGKRAPSKELSSLASSPWMNCSWQWEWFR